jgi:hypothetical protein
MEQLIESGSEDMASVFAGLFDLAMRIERERYLGAGHYVSVASPLNGLSAELPLVDSQTTTGPFLPLSAGPWKCAIVAGPESPL